MTAHTLPVLQTFRTTGRVSSPDRGVQRVLGHRYSRANDPANARLTCKRDLTLTIIFTCDRALLTSQAVQKMDLRFCSTSHTLPTIVIHLKDHPQDGRSEAEESRATKDSYSQGESLLEQHGSSIETYADVQSREPGPTKRRLHQPTCASRGR